MPLPSVRPARTTPRPRRSLARRLGLLAALAGLVATGLAAPGQALAGPRPTVAPAVTTAAAPLPGAYTAVTPTRVLDTRTGLGAPKGALPLRGSVSVLVAGTSGIPTTGVGAVVTTVTVTDTAGAGYLTAYPSGRTRPTTSTLNWTKGLTIANTAILPVGPDGRVVLYNGSTGSTDAVLDVEGWYAAGASTDPGAYTPIAPTRILDTRYGIGGPKGQIVHSYDCARLTAAEPGGPAAGAQALVVNVTATNGLRPGSLDAGGPEVVEWVTGETAAHLAVVPVQPDGDAFLCMTQPGPVDVVADLMGSLAGGVPTSLGRTVTEPQPTGGPSGWLSSGGSLVVAPYPSTPPGQVSAVLAEVRVSSAGIRGAGGYLTGGATGAPASGTSLMNWSGARAEHQLVVLPVGPDGTATVSISTTAVADVSVTVVGVVLASAPVLSTSWTVHPVPLSEQPTVLACASGGVCAAAFRDFYDHVDLARRDAGSWQQSALTLPPTPGAFLASCAGSGLCLAGETQPTNATTTSSVIAASTPGQEWALDTLPQATAMRLTVDDVGCALAGTSCWAVGQSVVTDAVTGVSVRAPYAAVRDASGWRQLPVPLEPGGQPGQNGSLNAVACRSDDDCLAVGQQAAALGASPYDLAVHWDGTTWSDVLPEAQDPSGSRQLLRPAPTADGYVVTGSTGVVSHWTVGDLTFGPTRATGAPGCLSDTVVCVAAQGRSAPAVLVGEPSDQPVTIVRPDPFPVSQQVGTPSCAGSGCVVPVGQGPAPLPGFPRVLRLVAGQWVSETLPLENRPPLTFGYESAPAIVVSCWATDACVAIGTRRYWTAPTTTVTDVDEWVLNPSS